MARVSVTVRLGTASSVRVRSCSSTPVGVKRTCSASSASTNSRATPAGSAFRRRIHSPGRPRVPSPTGPQCGRSQKQQRAVAQAGKIARAFGCHPHEPGGGWRRCRPVALWLCRGPQDLVGGRIQHRRGQAGLPVHGADRRPAAAERAAAEPGGAVDQVGGKRVRAGGQRRAALLPAPRDEARPLAGVQLEGRRSGIGDRIADHPDRPGVAWPVQRLARGWFSVGDGFGEIGGLGSEKAGITAPHCQAQAN